MHAEELHDFLNRARTLFSSVDRVVRVGAFEGEPDERRRDRLKAWGQALDHVDHGTAMRCLDSMHRGDFEHGLQFPGDWADRFPAVVRKWCSQNRPVEISAPASRFAEPQRLRCSKCFDSGWVTTASREFVETFRPEFEENAIGDIERTVGPRFEQQQTELRAWYQRVRRWRQRAGCGPLVFAMVCCCNHPVAVAKRRAAVEGHFVGAVFDPRESPVLRAGGPAGLYAACVQFTHKYRGESTAA